MNFELQFLNYEFVLKVNFAQASIITFSLSKTNLNTSESRDCPVQYNTWQYNSQFSTLKVKKNSTTQTLHLQNRRRRNEEEEIERT